MNETLSLLMATSILALGGLGFYMFQSNKQRGGDEDDYDEDNLFRSNGFWSSRGDDEDEDEPEYHEPKVRQRGGKTKRSKKNVGTKRRY